MLDTVGRRWVKYFCNNGMINNSRSLWRHFKTIATHRSLGLTSSRDRLLSSREHQVRRCLFRCIQQRGKDPVTWGKGQHFSPSRRPRPALAGTTLRSQIWLLYFSRNAGPETQSCFTTFRGGRVQTCKSERKVLFIQSRVLPVFSKLKSIRRSCNLVCG